MLGEELLGYLREGGRALVSGPLGCRIGTVGDRAKGFLSQRAGFVRRDGAAFASVRRLVGALRPLPARYFTT